MRRQHAGRGGADRAFALNNATLPFALKIANLGAEEAMRQDPHLANGLNARAKSAQAVPSPTWNSSSPGHYAR